MPKFQVQKEGGNCNEQDEAFSEMELTFPVPLRNTELADMLRVGTKESCPQEESPRVMLALQVSGSELSQTTKTGSNLG